MRDAGWIERYTTEGNVPKEVAWTKKGEAAVGMLRLLSSQLKLTEGEGVARVACWLAEQLGPDIRSTKR